MSADAPATASNITPADSEADLRRSFELALADSLKTENVTAGALEVCRKYLADKDADRRWQADRDALVPPKADPQPTAVRRLPFPVQKPSETPNATSEPPRHYGPATNVGPLGRSGDDFGFSGG